jgi:hypothetical protein
MRYGKLFNATQQAPLTSTLHPQGKRLDTDARLCGKVTAISNMHSLSERLLRSQKKTQQFPVKKITKDGASRTKVPSTLSGAGQTHSRLLAMLDSD